MTITNASMSYREASSILQIAKRLNSLDDTLSGLQLRLDDYVTTSRDVVVAMDHLYDAMSHITEAWEALLDAVGLDQDGADALFGEDAAWADMS